MGAISTAFTQAWRDYNTDGVPASGNRNTPKSDARALGATIESYFAAPWTWNNNAAENPTSAPTGYVERLIGKDADAYQMSVIDAFGGIPAVRMRRANGTGAAPTAVVNGNNLGQFDCSGWYVTGGPAYGTFGVSYRGEATENWTSTAQGARAVIATTPNGSATPVDALFIGQDQSVLAKGPIGNQTGVGAGGTVNQATNRTTGVTLNKPTGEIVVISAATGVIANFTVTNSFVGANDTVVVNHKAGSTDGYQAFAFNVAAGSFKIFAISLGISPATESYKLQFTVIKGAIS